MRRAIVHIGMPRTATSALQFFMARHRAALETAGILYPALATADGEAAANNHKPLGEALDGRRPRRERAALLAALDRMLATTAADTAILSYEGLCQIGWPRTPWRPLAAAFARRGFAMEILLTVKPQAEYLNSTYAWRMQFLREGRTFADYVAATLRGLTPEARRLDYGRLARAWQRAAEGRLAAVPVRAAGDGEPFLSRVFVETGLGDRVLPLIAPRDISLRVNRSPGPVSVEVARRLHRAGVPRRLDPAAAAEPMRFVQAEAKARGLDGDAFRGLTPALQRAIEERTAAANERFARAVWSAPWAERVAMPAPESVNEIGGPADPAVEEAIAAIMAAVAERFPVAAAGSLRRGRSKS
ncbi:MAG TPA: hypothetical protein VHD15_18845 [Hyphomicrobiales bacterium]|nr:hypothetical protein [Hyphomicrobiales bacterium]